MSESRLLQTDRDTGAVLLPAFEAREPRYIFPDNRCRPPEPNACADTERKRRVMIGTERKARYIYLLVACIESGHRNECEGNAILECSSTDKLNVRLILTRRRIVPPAIQAEVVPAINTNAKLECER